ncbi:MAG: NAD(P)H-dependent oxidoreductase subunit E [Anaerolineae bacterium]|nr:MAG: NAD(P)H-dependent oxidoreductase subunit E [Anaerolineae bacterium]
MDTTLSSEQIVGAVHTAIEAHGTTRGELIPILLDVNRTLGYVPTLAMAEISRQMRIPISEIFSVATFYTMIATEARGKHVIQFCENAPCHVSGGRETWQALLDTLGIAPGETSPDGKWTLLTTSCTGSCAVGPVMLVDDDLHGNLTPDKVAEILAQYD